MSQRERMLGLGVLAVILLWGGRMAWDKYQQSLSSKRSARSAAEQALSQAQLDLATAKYAAQQVTKWEEQSLPRNKSVAQSLYQSWLIDQLEEANLRFRDVVPGGAVGRTAAYETIGFNIEGEGDLPAIIRFLHTFHRSNALQKITLLHLRPTAQDGVLNVTLNVEALLLPTTSRESGMPEGTSDRLAVAEVDHYLKNITSRNPFVPYKPPPPEVVLTTAVEEPEPPPFDEASQARLTGIVGVGDQKFQAWVKILTTNEDLRLITGDEFKVGQLAGRVVEIRPRELVIEVDGKRQTVNVGKFLRDGIAEDGEI